MRIVSIVATIEYLILILNLIVIWQLCRIVHAYLATTVARILHGIRVRMTHAARQSTLADGSIRPIVKTTTMAPSTSMIHHHLGVVQLGLDLTAFIRSVQSILTAINLPIRHLLTIYSISLRLIARLVRVGRRGRLVRRLLLIEMVLRLALKMARWIVVTRRNRDILRLNAVVPGLAQSLLM